MTRACLDHLMDVVRATTLRGPTSLSWFGKRAPDLPTAVRRGLPSAAARMYLHTALQSRLYANFYRTGGAVPVRNEGAPQSKTAVAHFLKELGGANAGEGCWEPGWRVLGEQAGELEVVRAGLRIRVRPGQCVSDVEAHDGAGTAVRLRLPNALADLSPGYYMALGDAQLSHASPGEILRVYWHVTAPGAAALMQSITRSLNRAGVPFRFKTLINPTDYTRCDSAVLYILREHYEVVRPLLDPIYGEVARFLRWRTPVFTKALAPGLAIAEQPPSSESFGMDRCRVLADGLIRAQELKRPSPDGRLRVVLDRFRRAEIRPGAPYLNPGSMDTYEFSAGHRESTARVSSEDSAGSQCVPDELLRTAETIGRGLCERAVWHEDRCNWLGALPAPGATEGGWSWGSLGPDLYAGSSGVALFLAQLHAVSGSCEFRRTALGALRHAISRAEPQLGRRRLGLYTGWTGIAYTAVYAGLLLREEELVATGARLAARVMADAAEFQAFDLIDGKAGATLGLLALYDLLDDDALLESAIGLGRALVAGAQRREAGCSWPSPEFPQWRDLLGYSHGTAGAAAALIELYDLTHEPCFEQAVRGAFECERHWFNEGEANWPDLRSQPRRRLPRGIAFSTTWCHGAPGIALSRLRAHKVFGIQDCKTEALIALDTTRQYVESMLESGMPVDFCLCHGLCGNAEVLYQGHVALEQEFPAGKAVALRVAAAGIERYADGGSPWPCGPGGSGAPSLMIGLAGIGQFYLRLYDATFPSVLVFARDRLSKP